MSAPNDERSVKRTIKGLLLEMKLGATADERILAEETILNMFSDHDRVVTQLRAELETARRVRETLTAQRNAAVASESETNEIYEYRIKLFDERIAAIEKDGTK